MNGDSRSNIGGCGSVVACGKKCNYLSIVSSNVVTTSPAGAEVSALALPSLAASTCTCTGTCSTFFRICSTLLALVPPVIAVISTLSWSEECRGRAHDVHQTTSSLGGQTKTTVASSTTIIQKNILANILATCQPSCWKMLHLWQEDLLNHRRTTAVPPKLAPRTTNLFRRRGRRRGNKHCTSKMFAENPTTTHGIHIRSNQRAVGRCTSVRLSSINTSSPATSSEQQAAVLGIFCQ
jgi:hypothetical protein